MKEGGEKMQLKKLKANDYKLTGRNFSIRIKC